MWVAQSSVRLRAYEVTLWKSPPKRPLSYWFRLQPDSKKYREWQTGRWQQDIAYRDSLIRTHSLDRLKRLYEDKN